MIAAWVVGGLALAAPPEVIGVGVGDHDRRHLVLSDPGLSEALERGFVIAGVAGV